VPILSAMHSIVATNWWQPFIWGRNYFRAQATPASAKRWRTVLHPGKDLAVSLLILLSELVPSVVTDGTVFGFRLKPSLLAPLKFP